MKLGPYEVADVLGRGGMGVVYRARTAGGEEVALKVLGRPEGDAVARFDRERRLLAGFGAAEGFVALLDAGESPQGPFIVMPLMNGGTLRERLHRGPLGVDATVELGRDLARALGAAHARGIVHRDLKPENVLFHDGRPLVADLGLAKHFDRGAKGASQTVSLSLDGSARGTAGYMPPEQMSDAKSVGPTADVFALGAILHECLTGRCAFGGKTPLEVVVRVTDGRRDKLVRGDGPSWLLRAIDRALETRPEDRFPDGAAFLASLAPDGSGRARRTVALVAAALVIVGLGAYLALGAPRNEAKPPPPSPEVPIPKAPPDAATVAKRLRGGGAPEPGDLAILAASKERTELLRPLVSNAVIFPLAELHAAMTQTSGCRELETLEALAVLAAPTSTTAEREKALETAKKGRPDRTAGEFLRLVAIMSAMGDSSRLGDVPRDHALDEAFAPIAKRPELIVGAVSGVRPIARKIILGKYVAVEGIIGTTPSVGEPIFSQLSVVDGLRGLPPEIAISHAAFRYPRTIREQVKSGKTEVVDRCVEAAKALETSDPVVAAHGYAVACDFVASEPAHAAAERLVALSLARESTREGDDAVGLRECAAHLAWQDWNRHLGIALVSSGSARAAELTKALEAARTEVDRARDRSMTLQRARHRVLILLVALGRESEATNVPPFQDEPFALLLAAPETAQDVERILSEVVATHASNDFVKTSAAVLRIHARKAAGSPFDKSADESFVNSVTYSERVSEVALERLAAERLRFR